MSPYDRLREELRAAPRTWLVTGVAGFIGSHLLETLLLLGQRVVGVDNFTTGSPANLESVREAVSAEQWERFDCREGSITDIGICREATREVDYVLHQASFVSVPLSIEDPVACHDINVTGTLNILIAARDHRVRRVVYASTSKVYGDDPRLPKVEGQIGRQLSPYSTSKLVNELYAQLFTEQYGLETVGLRLFNGFGSRQNPFGGYAAVIPHWIHTMLQGDSCPIYGDGTATRDFCPVENFVQANLLAATALDVAPVGKIYNVGLGQAMSLNELHERLATALETTAPEFKPRPPVFGPARPGTVQDSCADLSRIREELGYLPAVSFEEALRKTVQWYADSFRRA